MGIVAVMLARRTDRPVFAFVVFFWLFSQPALEPLLENPIPGLGFALHPQRVLLGAMIAFIALSAFGWAGRRAVVAASNRGPYEKYAYLLLVCVCVALIYNRGEIREQLLLVIPLQIITFIAVHEAGKRLVTPKLLDGLLAAIIVMGVVSAVIAIVQFFVDPYFLKTANPRGAFGATIRSSGVFSAEYQLGHFLVLSSMVALCRYRGFWRTYVFLPLLMLGLLVTFHRLSYIIAATCLVGYVLLHARPAQRVTAISVIVIGTTVLFGVLSLAGVFESKSAFVEDRLQQDTVTGRLKQYVVAIQALPNHPLGMGSYDNPEYDRLMARHQLTRNVLTERGTWESRGFTVHNGFLEIGMLYGTPSMATFALLLFSKLRFFWYRYRDNPPFSNVAFFGVLILIMANISNAISQFSLHYLLLVALIAGFAVAGCADQKQPRGLSEFFSDVSSRRLRVRGSR